LTLRDYARNDFDEFMKDATPFEMYLMKDILRAHWYVCSASRSRVHPGSSARQRDRQRSGIHQPVILRVPEGSVELVRALIHSGQAVKETVEECA
jgi:hypothetical protein